MALAGFLSTVIGLYAAVPYVLAVLAGKTKPHQLGWFVWVLMNGVVFLSQYFEGARASVLVTLGFLVSSTIIFVLSIKYGVRESSKWDKLLFVSALFTIGVWVLTKNNVLAIFLTILIDIFATTMLLLKVKAHPFSEEPFPWVLVTLAYVFSCITLVNMSPGILYIRPIYGLAVDALIVGYIYYARHKSSKNMSNTV